MGTATAKLQDNAGMTVVEVMIALGVITVGLVALIAAMPLSTSRIEDSNLKTTATFLAQQRLEQIRNAQWTIAADTLGGPGSNGTAAVAQWPDEGYDTIVIPMGESNASYLRFRRQVRINDCSVIACSGIPTGTAGINALREITVTVFFLSGVGTGRTNEESVRLVTLITQRL